jgi:hypothetical protein
MRARREPDAIIAIVDDDASAREGPRILAGSGADGREPGDPLAPVKATAYEASTKV